MTTMTPAAHRYIAGLYECFIDKGLDLEEIRLALRQHGIKRNIYQIEFDLNERYCFAGYAASHQPAPRQTLAELKTKEARDESRKGRVRMPDGRYSRLPAPAAH